MNDWWLHAACRNAPSEAFFPTGEGWQHYTAAKQVCAGCEVRGDCLTYALRAQIEHGVWGGRDPAERRKMRRAGDSRLARADPRRTQNGG